MQVEVWAERDQHDPLSTNWNSAPHRSAKHDEVIYLTDKNWK